MPRRSRKERSARKALREVRHFLRWALLMRAIK